MLIFYLDGLFYNKIEKFSQYGGFDSKYIGKYKNDIVIEKDGNFVKIGERVLEITRADDKNVAGRYFETYKPGFEEYFESKYKYDFTFEMAQDNQQNTFTYTNPSGQQEMGQIHSGGNGKLYLNLNIEIVDKNSTRSKGTGLTYKLFDGQFSRVFDE